MRNWNEEKIDEYKHWFSHVFILPMRNWNPIPPIGIYLLWVFSSYLWGIETLHVKIIIVLFLSFSSYLWGIETYFYFSVSIRSLSFSSYLWGIETCSDLAMVFFGNSFHLTYEELKLVPLPPQCGQCTSFHLTYEELKRDEHKIQPGILGEVFILPMRNWNWWSLGKL